MTRRNVVVTGAATVAALGFGHRFAAAQDASTKTGVDPAKWNPEEIRKIAGTLEVDTAADVSKIVPLDYAGESSYWYVGPTEATT